MGNLHISSRLEVLCQKLADEIRNKKNSIFDKEVIITQSAGMTAWLKTELAMSNRVFANFDFMNQDGLFAEIYKLLFGERLKNNVIANKYRIYSLLAYDDFKNSFPDVAGYYEGDELRRFQLSEKIGDLFDQYQLYRPEMLEGWENGNSFTTTSGEKWQSWLWTELNIPSRAQIKDKIVNQLKVNVDSVRQAFPGISFFGITIYTDFHLGFFRELAKHTNVDFYICLPSSSRDFQNELLLSYGFKAGELMDLFGIREVSPEPVPGNTMLSSLQEQIAKNTNSLITTGDDSIQVNSCYTPVREVECLYNYLLDLFDKDRTLKPGDILVMATDINKYAPFVRAVFRNAPIKIPFRVSGAANNSEDSITSALELILKLTEDDLTAEKVVSLLEQGRIKKRYSVTDCDYIRAVVNKANIRFGRENRVEDDSVFVSWKYGLDKILLGYAMLTDEEYPFNDSITLYPFKDAEASASHDLFRLKAFVEQLEHILDEQQHSRTLSEWKSFLFEQVIEPMIWRDDFEKEDRAELNSIYRALSFIDSLEFTQKVPFAVFLDELESRLFKEAGEMNLNTGNVTVSAPIPVRGLPFKVICFLGLDNGVFPRKDQFMGFDLLGEEYRIGDRSKNETDKYLFLETLLAARGYLYLSYLGRSVKDNSEIPPSIVIDILLDYLPSENILAEQPLHGFSAIYRPENKRLFTYLYGPESSECSVKEKEEPAITEITIKSLTDFFKAPLDWYFNSVLGIKFDEKDSTLPEAELFELDHLQQWLLKKELLKINKEDLEPILVKGIKEGILSLKVTGEVILEEIYEQIEDLKGIYETLVNGRSEDNVVIDLKINNILIKGTIDSVYDREFLAYSVSNHPEKYKPEALIKALLLMICGKIDSARFMNLLGVVTRIPVNSQTAESELAALLDLYLEGALSPLLFTISSALESIKSGSDIKKVLKTFEKEAYPDENSPMPSNPYLQILFKEGRFQNFGEHEFEKIKEVAGKLYLNNI